MRDCPEGKLGIRRSSGTISVVKNYSCSILECLETGCSFPYCANLEAKEYPTLRDIQKDYPNISVFDE